MRKLFVVLALATGACETRNEPTQTPAPNPSDPWATAPAPAPTAPSGFEARPANTQTRSATSSWDTDTPVTTDEDFNDVRAKFSADVQKRMDALEIRIGQLEAEAKDLRAEQEELTSQLKTTPDQSRENWEKFKADVRAALSRLETELNARR